MASRPATLGLAPLKNEARRHQDGIRKERGMSSETHTNAFSSAVRHIDPANASSTEPSHASAITYWRTVLSDAPAVLELPTDRSRPPKPSPERDCVEIRIESARVTPLRESAASDGIEPDSVLTASWAAAMARLSGQQSVVVGVDRGCGLLPIRVDLDLQSTSVELIAQVARRMEDASANGSAGFDTIVAAVQPARSDAHAPLCQTRLDWCVSQSAPPTGFDFILGLCEQDGCIVGSLSYITALFDRDTVVRYAGYWMRLLQGMVDRPDAEVSTLPLLASAERETLLRTWNATGIEYPRGACMHELIEAQAARTPEATALVCGDVRWTYAELNTRANRLAHQLRTLGVGPDVRVGICARRQAPLLVALLASLKSGGAYVPLDPSYPADRLGYILDDAQPAVVLTDGSSRGVLAQALSLAEQPQSPVVLDLVADEAQWSGQPSENPSASSVGLTPMHLGYLIYTSGSTGRPKGVAIEHRNAVNFMAWAQGAFEREVLSNVLFSTSINFDLSIYEYCVPLSVGGTVTLVENALVLLEGPQPVTLINTVPSVMVELTKASAVPETVRVVNVAGEPLKRALGEAILSSSRVERLCNLYGPSETTTYSTWVRMDRGSGFVGDIGCPIGNTQVYVLDGVGEPVPVGVSGEIWIGGAGVARGYLGKPELTAERFVEDRFSAEPGARMYRTGDLGRWTREGRIELLGRNDFQVKIRGFRIELGEIEMQLSQCAGVRESLVLAREDVPGEKRLVAYVLSEASLEVGEVRDWLSKRLPEYMVPSAVVRLEAWPLTPNGKLDRKSLPAPDAEAYARTAYEAPQGEVEERVAALWSELLRIDRVGRHDNFFGLGGHSLIAMQLVLRVRSAFRIDLPMETVFDQPSLSKMAEAIRVQQLATYLGDDLDGMVDELDGLSEEELLILLEKESLDG
jgi:amino acid adenylation domain-containing protein